MLRYLSCLTIAAAVAFAMVPVPMVQSARPARADDNRSCEVVSPWVKSLRQQLDVLKIDYPAEWQLVCRSPVMASVQPGGQFPMSGLLDLYRNCQVGQNPDCSYVVGQFVDLMEREAVLRRYAEQSNCAVPSFPSPC